MKIQYFLALAVVLVYFDKRNRARTAQSPVDAMYSAEASQFGQMNGTNFTRSMWDAASGQPTYMFGAIDAPGGAATMGNFANDGVAMVGHLA